MLHARSPIVSTLLRQLLPAIVGLAAAGAVLAQTADANNTAALLAQQQFNRDIAVCNESALPAPQRALCIRDAGERFDRLRGLPPAAEATPSADGRATVMTPSSGSTALRGSTAITTTDGRATVVVPETATP